MAATIRGTALTWGCASITGGVQQSYKQDDQVDHEMGLDHQGEVTTDTTFNLNYTFDTTFLYTVGTGAGAITAGTATTVFGAFGGTGLQIVYKVSHDTKNKAYKSISISGAAYPAITS